MKIKSGQILTFLLLGSAVAGRAETVELTGMASLFGQKMALLAIHQPAQSKPLDVTLSEGETSGGIQLLAIDFSLRTVQILNAGQRQTLHICGAALATIVTNGGRVAANGITVYHADGSYEFLANTTGVAGTAGLAVPPNPAGGAPGNGVDPATPSKTDSNLNDDSASPPEQAKTYQWWVKEAEKIERARTETAARVKTGEWQPYPRTPLTPDNTPAELVSADEVFMDHGPGIVIPDN
ncbi:MAG TPA: hypothetical protein VG347_00620 [Verrucomicrobiae bacterium]|nr:hypothetical protein [Verrucomicrobiae bacterium]